VAGRTATWRPRETYRILELRSNLFSCFYRKSSRSWWLIVMETNLVRRDQFSISPQGIVHKPTDAAFTPNPGDPFSGTSRMGQLVSEPPIGNFSPDDVQRLMRQLWAEYVASNSELFNLS
jgi:hypothetical protein